MDYRKLYDALITIIYACEEMKHGSGCKKCPMSADFGGTCCVTDTTPDNWEVIPPETKLMR